MQIFLHDATPAVPGENHGPDGLTHAGTIRVDYEYQVEVWVQQAQQNLAHIVRIRCPDLGREWKRTDGKFAEVPWAGASPV